MVMVANNTFKSHTNMMLVAKAYDMDGKEKLLTQVFVDVTPSTAKRYLSLKKEVDELAKDKGAFLTLQLLDKDKKIISQNTYWLADEKGNYSGLQKMPKGNLNASAKYLTKDKIEVTLTNNGNGPLAFFNRLSLVNADTKQRVLPAFYSDNYVTVLPGEEKKVIIDWDQITDKKNFSVAVSGWNISEQYIQINN
jgi:hypothetical protein